MIPVSESVLVSVGQQVSPIRGTQHINLVIPAFDYIDLIMHAYFKPGTW